MERADAAGLLISEAARGEGGILRNALGERFMSRYDSERMELSTRDRVASATSTENGRIVGQAAASHSRQLHAQMRSSDAVDVARDEIDSLLAGRGFDNVRSMQRAIRDLMTEYAGVVRNEEGLRTGLTKLDAVRARLPDLAVHPDIAGFDDLAHALDLKGALIAARARPKSPD